MRANAPERVFTILMTEREVREYLDMTALTGPDIHKRLREVPVEALEHA